jgi:pimeloyl-ACP methyl ester carboxylesterase
MGRWCDRAGTDSAYSMEWAKYLADSANDGFGDNGEGWWEDWCATFLPWDIDISGVKAPVSLWHGVQDEMVLATHARWYQSSLSGIEFYLLDGIHHTNVDEDTRAAALEWISQFRITAQELKRKLSLLSLRHSRFPQVESPVGDCASRLTDVNPYSVSNAVSNGC